MVSVETRSKMFYFYQRRQTGKRRYTATFKIWRQSQHLRSVNRFLWTGGWQLLLNTFHLKIQGGLPENDHRLQPDSDDVSTQKLRRWLVSTGVAGIRQITLTTASTAHVDAGQTNSAVTQRFCHWHSMLVFISWYTLCFTRCNPWPFTLFGSSKWC